MLQAATVLVSIANGKKIITTKIAMKVANSVSHFQYWRNEKLDNMPATLCCTSKVTKRQLKKKKIQLGALLISFLTLFICSWNWIICLLCSWIKKTFVFIKLIEHPTAKTFLQSVIIKLTSGRVYKLQYLFIHLIV